MSGTSLAEAMLSRVLVADGAMGSLLNERIAELKASGCDARMELELIPLCHPDMVASVHEAYVEAGADIIKTATFNANADSLFAVQRDWAESPYADAAALSYAINSGAAKIARACADAACMKDGRVRWVAGSVGPGNKSPSLGAVSFAELALSYAPQMRGLVDGGADLILIETAQDALQCKAAAYALKKALRECDKNIPFIVSATMEPSGQMLTGTSPEAFCAIMEPLGPLLLGLNCSGGPAELESACRRLSACSGVPVALMPNAGLPISENGKIRWPLAAASFAELTARIVSECNVSLVGGCCGTNPAYIAELAVRAARLPAARPRQARRFRLASAFAPYDTGSGVLVIDERANASGSAAFKQAVKEGGVAGAVGFILERADTGVPAVDVCISSVTEDEPTAFAEIARQIGPIAKAAISVDSLDEGAVERALACLPGRPILNSVNLEKPEQAEHSLAIAADYGAAVVCLCLDADGPARTVEAKLAIALRFRTLAEKVGLSPQDIAFDVCTFPAAVPSGIPGLNLARETLEAIAAVKKNCPGSATVLGVGNVSFGLPKKLRPFFTARFLRRAVAQGLDAAIVDPALVSRPIEPGLESLIDGVIDEGSAGAMDALLLHWETLTGSAVPQGTGAQESVSPTLDTAGELEAAILGGKAAAARLHAGRCISEGAPFSAVAEAIARSMVAVGEKYERGGLALPLVLRSADSARAAFAVIKESSNIRADDAEADLRDARPVVLATVRGDLHDIGKNLVAMVFEAAGYRVVDLGTDVSAEAIADAARTANARAVGVSGLLSKSLEEMVRVADALASRGSDALLLCGGAAVSEDYIMNNVARKHSFPVRYARDPFQGIAALREIPTVTMAGSPSTGPQAAETGGAVEVHSRGAVEDMHGPAGHGAPMEQKKTARTESFHPPSIGSWEFPALPYGKLLEHLDTATLVKARWGFSSLDSSEAQEALSSTLRSLEDYGGLEARIRYGFLSLHKITPDVVTLAAGGLSEDFAFPREATGARRSLADYYAPDDTMAAFCLTLGLKAVEYLAAIRSEGSSERYLRAHGLLAALAEAAAELAHADIGGRLIQYGAECPGRRYSFGFAGCPGVESNGLLLRLLCADSIGMGFSAGCQLTPEFSVSAVVIPRLDAIYFGA